MRVPLDGVARFYKGCGTIYELINLDWPAWRAELAAGPPVLWTAYGRNLTMQCLRSPAG